MPDHGQSKASNAKPSERIEKKASKQSEGEGAVLSAIAAMPRPDRDVAERLHAIIKESAPALSPKLWYTMPAYAKEGKVICFFRESTHAAGHRSCPIGRRHEVCHFRLQ